jgi:hypothetical protein
MPVTQNLKVHEDEAVSWTIVTTFVVGWIMAPQKCLCFDLWNQWMSPYTGKEGLQIW